MAAKVEGPRMSTHAAAARQLLLALIAVVVGACGVPPSPSAATTPPPGELTRATAIERASQLVDSVTPIQLVSAEDGPFSEFSGGTVLTTLHGDPWVWSVVFAGSFPLPCSSPTASGSREPTVGPCPSLFVSRQRVIIDAATGTLLLLVGGS